MSLTTLNWPLLPSAWARAQALARSTQTLETSTELPGLPTTLYVGLSGGVDSVVLLDLALAWQAALAQGAQGLELQQLRVVALHAHHGLQAPADGWLQACVERCARLDIELVSTRLALGAKQRSEAAARSARYDFFRRQMHKSTDCLLLAHHSDDQAETLLLRVAQGRAVLGMPESRPLGLGLLVRPLLNQRREAIEAYAQQHKLTWVEDPTNALLAADRNFVRHQWLPAAAARWPDLVPSLTGLADRQRQQAELLVQLVADWEIVPVAQARLLTGSSLLRAWLLGRGESSVTQLGLDEFCAQLGAEPDRSPSLRLAQGELRRYADAVHYVTDLVLAEVALAAYYEIASPGELLLPHGRLTISGPAAQLQVHFAQTLKSSLFAPALKGRHWHRAGVPPWLRPSFPQLFDGSRRLGVPVHGVSQHAGQTTLPHTLGTTMPKRRWQVRWEPFKGQKLPD